MNLSNLDARTKRLLMLLGAVLAFAAYMLLFNKPDDPSSTGTPSAQQTNVGGDSGSGTDGDTGGGSAGGGDNGGGSTGGGSTGGGSAGGGSAGGGGLPADPTQGQRPGTTTTKLPQRFPGTQQVILVYNPFRSQ